VLQPPWRSLVFEAEPRCDRARLHARFPVAGEGLGKYRMHPWGFGRTAAKPRVAGASVNPMEVTLKPAL
jgi:hypothetical protein